MSVGPKPPPPGSKALRRLGPLPSTHVVPTVQTIIQDVYTIVKAEVDAVRRRAATSQANGAATQAMSMEDARRLKTLLESLNIANNMDTQLQDAIGAAIADAGADEETLAALAEGDGNE